MTTHRTIHAPKPERLKRLASPMPTGRASVPPSTAYGARWKALPVEGTKAYRRKRGGLLMRLTGR